MIKFALCDDNPQLVSKLQEMLEKIFLKHDFDASVVFSSCDASSLLSFLNTNDVDVLFLDIDLNSSLNGIQLAKEIRKRISQFILFLQQAILNILFLLLSVKLLISFKSLSL